MAEENGLVQIYYGDGKGKTTAAFGLAFRCAGWGRRVVIAQFLKSSPCGELTAAERPGCSPQGRPRPVDCGPAWWKRMHGPAGN